MAWFLGILTSSSCSQAHEPGPSAEIYKVFSMPWLFYRFASGWITIGHGSRCMTTTIDGRHGPVASSQSDDGGQAALTISHVWEKSTELTSGTHSSSHGSLEALEHLARLVSPPPVLDEEMVPGRLARKYLSRSAAALRHVMYVLRKDVQKPHDSIQQCLFACGSDLGQRGGKISGEGGGVMMATGLALLGFEDLREQNLTLAVWRWVWVSTAWYPTFLGSGQRRKFPFLAKIRDYPASLTLPMTVTAAHCSSRHNPPRNYAPEGHSKSVVGGIMMTFKRLSTLKIDERTRPNFVFPALSLPWGIRGLRIYHYTPLLPSPSVSPPTPAPLRFKIPIELINHLPTLGMYGECIF
ncbi:hypothetical protein CPB85DRAFT_1258826 [Mucidula mucida]|nr:hypothetical protein CPB85DRAFT_1258826 [Mucidula mucida]